MLDNVHNKIKNVAAQRISTFLGHAA